MYGSTELSLKLLSFVSKLKIIHTADKGTLKLFEREMERKLNRQNERSRERERLTARKRKERSVIRTIFSPCDCSPVFPKPVVKISPPPLSSLIQRHPLCHSGHIQTEMIKTTSDIKLLGS